MRNSSATSTLASTTSCIVEFVVVQVILSHAGAFEDAVNDVLEVFECGLSCLAVFGFDGDVEAHGFAVSFDDQGFATGEERGGFVFEFADADVGHGFPFVAISVAILGSRVNSNHVQLAPNCRTLLRMNVAKLSVSLDPRKLEFISKYQQTHGVRTKSEVVERAIKLLEHEELKTQYAQAYSEWAQSGEETVWDVTSADGLEPEDWGEFRPREKRK